MTNAIYVFQVLRRSLLTKLISSPRFSPIRKKSNLWSPDYLEDAKSKFPEYSATNIQIRGYDFAILEKYQSKIHWITKLLGVDVTDCWAQEHQKLKVITYKPKSELVECEYILKYYERNIQVSYVYSYQMGTLMDLVISTCPPGVTVQCHPHTDFHFQNRFVPEIRLLELKDLLKQMENEK